MFIKVGFGGRNLGPKDGSTVIRASESSEVAVMLREVERSFWGSIDKAGAEPAVDARAMRLDNIKTPMGTILTKGGLYSDYKRDQDQRRTTFDRWGEPKLRHPALVRSIAEAHACNMFIVP